MTPPSLVNPLFIDDTSSKDYRYELILTPSERDTIHSALSHYYEDIEKLDVSISINIKERKDGELHRVKALSKVFGFDDIGELEMW